MKSDAVYVIVDVFEMIDIIFEGNVGDGGVSSAQEVGG